MTMWRNSGVRRWPAGAGALAVAAAGAAALVTVPAAARPSPRAIPARSATVRAARSRLSGPSGRRSERIAVTGGGQAVYRLGGETTHHLLCKSAGCFAVWPPVKVRGGTRPSAAGVSGHLGTLRRDGFVQVTLNGDPLYTFAPDGGRRDFASGDGVRNFGGVWHVLREG